MNYTETEITKLQWKIEVYGLSFCNSFKGLPKLSIMKSTEIPRPSV